MAIKNDFMYKGVQIQELKNGIGQIASKNTAVRICYDSYLRRGDVFQKGMEYTFDLSRRQVIAGLRYGIEGMREGGRRKIQVSPHLAYGERGIPGVIPPNAMLIFDVELLEVIDLTEEEVHRSEEQSLPTDERQQPR